jgi:hypothetical protein
MKVQGRLAVLIVGNLEGKKALKLLIITLKVLIEGINNMRKIRGIAGTLNITKWIQTSNFWEFYVTDKKMDDDLVYALVMGDFTELGLVSLEEIRPYIRISTEDLSTLQPADGYKWED